jgi:hypothetical protein
MPGLWREAEGHAQIGPLVTATPKQFRAPGSGRFIGNLFGISGNLHTPGIGKLRACAVHRLLMPSPR